MGAKRTKRRLLATSAFVALVVLAVAGSGAAQSASGSAPGAGEPVTPVTTSVAPSVPPVTLTPVPTTTTAPTAAPTTAPTAPSPDAIVPSATPTSTAALTTVPTVVPSAAPTAPTPTTTLAPVPADTPAPTPSTGTQTPNPAVTVLEQPTPVPAPTETPSPASPPPPTEPPSAATEPPAAANATPVPVATTSAEPTPVPTTLAPTIAPTSPPPPTEPPTAASPPPPTEPPTQPPAAASTPAATAAPTSTAPTVSTVAPAPTPTSTPTPVPTTVVPSPSSESPPPPTEPPTNPPPSTPSTSKPPTTTAPPKVTPTPSSGSPPPPTQPANRTPVPDADSGSGSSNEPSTPKPSASATTDDTSKSSTKTTTAPNFSSVPSPNEDDGAGKVTPPDLSTLDPIVGDLPGASNSNNKSKKADSSKVVENDTKSAHDSSAIGGLNLAIIVVGIVGVVIASLFFVRSRHIHRKMSKPERDSSQQRALDEFFQANVGTTAPATGLPRHLISNASSSQYSGGRSRGVSSNSYANDQLTPADEIALAGAAAAAGRQNQNRFDDSVLRGTAAFRMNGPLPPSPVDPNLSNSDRGSSEVESLQPSISFVSSGSSASRFGTEANFYSEVHGSDIGDFRSTGGAQSMVSGLESRRSTAVHSDSSAFSVYMKSSGGNSADLGADFRLSSGVYSVGDIESRSSRASSYSSRTTSSHRGITRTFSHESFGSARSSSASSDGFSDNAFSIVSKDSLAFGADSMHRMSELSEGEI